MLVDQQKPDLAVIDLKMPRQTGFALLHVLREKSPATRSVILTGYGSIVNAVDALHAGAVNYLPKPADADQILEAFRRADLPPPTPEPEQIHAPSLAEAVPYAVVLVSLDEHPHVRILGNVLNRDPGEVEIGQKVRATFETIEDEEAEETILLPQWEVV